MKPTLYPLLLVAFLTACSSSSPDIEQAEQLRKSGNPMAAIGLLQTTMQTSPDDPQLFVQMGYALLEVSHPKEAIAAFDHALALSHDNASAYNGKGVALDHLKKHAKAQKEYQSALKITPDAVSVQNNLAMSMILNDQYNDAIALLEKLRLTTDSKTVRQNLAMAYALKGDKKKSLELNLVDLSPDEAKENMRSYQQYKNRHSAKKNPAPTLTPEQEKQLPQ